MSEAARACPSIYSEEYKAILEKATAARTDAEYQKACTELLIFIDLHIDGIRQAYEARGAFQPLQAGTMVYCSIEPHLVRNGRVYGHRITEISGQETKAEYLVNLFFDGGDTDNSWIPAYKVFANATEAFEYAEV